MNLEEILGLYRSDERVKSIAGKLGEKKPTSLHLRGLVGSAPSLIAAAIFKETTCNHLFICNDKE